jgi:membrane-bound serine protease (ClpP class)
VFLQIRRAFTVGLLVLGLVGLLGAAASAQSPGAVYVASVTGIINPVQAGYVDRVIDQAEEAGAAAVVIQLDTPGGLDKSMREINQRILAARVPVIVFVWPPGARAGSAGVYMTYSAHVAAMGPNTNIGSATPVMMGEGGEAQLSDEMKAKIQNDAIAYIRGLAERRGRNADWAEQAVRQGANVTAAEAVQQRIVDLQASDLQQLLERADGRTVDLASGPVPLRTAGAPVVPAEMNWVEQLLHVISDPTIAYILLGLGSLGLTLELYNPGSVVPGVVGGLCLLLAFYALGTLPVNYAGLMLLGFAFLLFIADLFAPTHGVLTVGGLIAFVLGSLMLFNAPEGAEFLRVSFGAIFTMAALFAGFFAFCVSAIVRGQRRHVTTGREGLLGQVAEVRTRLGPEGLVFVESELWRARTVGRAVEPGEDVRVLAVKGLELTVEPLSVEAPPAQAPMAPAAPADTAAIPPPAAPTPAG